MPELLLELFSEEIPAPFQRRAAEGTVERPLCQQQAPILKEGSEKGGGGHGMELEFGLNER